MKIVTGGRQRAAWIVIAAGLAAVGALAYVLLRPPAATMPVADPGNPQQVALGRSVYDRACAECHGKNLEGQPDWQRQLPSGGLPAPPHDETGHTWHHADELLFRVTKYGGQSVAPRGFKSNMPAFEGRLSDAEIAAVLAYIKNRWPETIRERQAGLNRRQQQQ